MDIHQIFVPAFWIFMTVETLARKFALLSIFLAKPYIIG